MRIVLTPVGSAKSQGDQTVTHDLNFQEEEYEATHKVVSSAAQSKIVS